MVMLNIFTYIDILRLWEAPQYAQWIQKIQKIQDSLSRRPSIRVRLYVKSRVRDHPCGFNNGSDQSESRTLRLKRIFHKAEYLLLGLWLANNRGVYY